MLPAPKAAALLGIRTKITQAIRSKEPHVERDEAMAGCFGCESLPNRYTGNELDPSAVTMAVRGEGEGEKKQSPLTDYSVPYYNAILCKVASWAYGSMSETTSM
jgi:hypothetical protein